MLHLDDRSIETLKFIEAWCEDRHVYDLEQMQSVTTIVMPRCSDCCHLMDIPADLRKRLNLQFHEFAQDGEGGSFALWQYPELVGEPPVVFFSGDGHYSMVAPSLRAFFALMALGLYMFPAIGKETEHVWQAKSSWHPDLDQIMKGHNFKTFAAAEKALEASLTELHDGLSEIFEIEDAGTYLEQMQKHKNFRKWYEYAEANKTDAAGQIGGNLYEPNEIEFTETLETETLLKLLYQPLESKPVGRLLEALNQDSENLSRTEPGLAEIDREENLGLTVRFSTLTEEETGEARDVLTHYVFYENWAHDLPYGMTRCQNYDDVAKLLGRPADSRHKYMAFTRYWKLPLTGDLACLLGVRFEKDLSRIKAVTLQTFTPEDEKTNKYGHIPL